MTIFSIKITRDLILETFAVIFGALYTILYTYEIIWCWLAAIISSVLFVYLVYSRKLFAETALHSFYFVMGFYGWYQWGMSYPKGEYLGLNNNLIYIAVGIALTVIVGTLLKRYSSSKLPYVDSFTTVFSIIATILMTHSIIDNWAYWIIIDAVSIVLYASRGLYLSALLFVFYTILAVNGLKEWMV